VSSSSKELTVCVVSGPTLSGKSYMLNWLLGLPEYKDVVLIEMDKIRRSVFGNRELTDTEHVFKNEAVLHALRTKLIVERPRIVFLEMGLPTEDKHQKPLVAAVTDAQRYIKKIESERDEECDLRINLKVILNYCDIESVKRRIVYRSSQLDDESCTNVFDLETWLRDMSLLFETPRVYKPLPVNTSNESAAAVQEYRQEVISFIDGGWPIDQAAWMARTNEFRDLINQARQSFAELNLGEQARKMYGKVTEIIRTNHSSDLFKNIKLLALDCDGVMTDGTTLVGTATLGSDIQKMTGATGIELARFNHRDGAGIHALIETGVPVIMITSQRSEYVKVRGEKLRKANGSDDRRFAYFYQIENKVQCLIDYLAKHHPEISLDQVCYMGDDIGDISIMKAVGLPIAVQDAQPEAKEVALHITDRAGGNGAVREVCDLIMKKS